MGIQAVKIIFEAHSTTVDNEAHLASGHNDVELSELGLKQAAELGQRYIGQHFQGIFCSDLKRSYHTAEIAFQGRGVAIYRDPRLRECDYGDFTQQPSTVVDPEKLRRIDKPFPNGESYRETSLRMKSFLDDLALEFSGKEVMIIGHRATQYGLEHWLNGRSYQDIIATPWSWQPGWRYEVR